MAPRLVVALLIGVALVPLSGCLDPFRPHVPQELIDASEHTWVVTEHPLDEQGWFQPDIVQTEYRYDGGAAGPPFPALLIVMGIRGVTRFSENELLDRTRAVLEETLEEEGVTVDPAQERQDSRTLRNGATTQWFRLGGTSSDDAPLFASEEEIRVLGEAWYDGRSSTSVIAVVLAQTTGPDPGPGGLVGNSVRDHSVWDELVGDEDGSVGGAISSSGFIDHMVSHG